LLYPRRLTPLGEQKKVGWLTPTSRFNPGKVSELADRKHFKV